MQIAAAVPCKRNVFNGLFVKHRRSTGVKEQNSIDNVLIDLNYEIGHICEGGGCDLCFPGCRDLLDTLVRGLSSCSK